MAHEVPVAKWELLFEHIPVAIDQLRKHDAHCSFEAAELLECALDVLRAVDVVRAYDSITQTIGELVQLGLRRETLPKDTTHFLEVLSDDLTEAFAARGEREVIAQLSCHPSSRT